MNEVEIKRRQSWLHAPGRRHSNLLFLLMIFISLFARVDVARAFESTLDYAQLPRYRQLDQAYNQFSTSFYQTISGQSQAQDYRSFDLIVSEARHELSQGDTAGALILLISHDNLLRNNLNSRGIIEAESLLLQGDEYNTARHYLKFIEDNSDPTIISNVQYAFAKYYFEHNRWRKTIDTLNNIINDLPTSEYAHALLMQGISLQNLHQQRKALALYKGISQKSPDYIAARINMAIAETRQGWWTDGYDTLNNLLKRKDVKADKALSDRIHTLIGYIFLQQEYYRNSRNAFRNVEIEGPYTYQALLGIALDAGYQKDYVGALNAARILKDKNSSALQVDEANLLLPYFYEKLGQTATASAGYSDAINYYKTRIIKLNKLLSVIDNLSRFPVTPAHTVLSIQDENIDLGDYLPPAFFKQYSLLNAYTDRVENTRNAQIVRQHDNLVLKYQNLMKSILAQSVKSKKAYLTDYMNQSRYGLARLYDRTPNSAQ